MSHNRRLDISYKQKQRATEDIFDKLVLAVIKILKNEAYENINLTNCFWDYTQAWRQTFLYLYKFIVL